MSKNLIYQIPSSYQDEIEHFETQVKEFRSENMEDVVFKGIRVAQGIYEQRKSDTYMVRMRNAGGVVLPSQLKKVAQTSALYGTDHFHVTTRQDLQLHYSSLEDIRKIQESLAEAGISTRGGGGNTVRNMIVSPDSGIRTDEVFDVTPYAIALTTQLIAEPDSFELPRKLKFAFHNGPESVLQTAVTCVGFTAVIRNKQKGFRVEIGGGTGARPMIGALLIDFLPVEDLYLFAYAVKRVFDLNGNRRNRNKSRLKFLREKLGTEALLRMIHKEMSIYRTKNIPTLNPLSIENKDESSPDLVPVFLDSDAFQFWKMRYVKEQKQEGLFSILVPLRLGDIKNEDGILLAELLEQLGPNTLRTTVDQNLLLRNIPERFLGNIFILLQKTDTLSNLPRIMGDMLACTGAATCKLGLCLPRGAVPEIQKKLAQSNLDLDELSGFTIHISGCPNSCGRHHESDLGFFGRASRNDGHIFPAYNVVAGARCDRDGKSTLARKIAVVATKHTPDFVEAVLQRWTQIKSKYTSFADYIDEIGEKEVAEIAGKYKEIPLYNDDSSFYKDWGSTEDFSILKGQQAECSASVFDLIGQDFRGLKKVTKELNESPSKENLSQAVLLSARMLLLARGIEPKNDEFNLTQFQQHFIEAGLIDASNTTIVDKARKDLSSLELEDLPGILKLSADIQELYSKLDDSLKFRL